MKRRNFIKAIFSAVAALPFIKVADAKSVELHNPKYHRYVPGKSTTVISKGGQVGVFEDQSEIIEVEGMDGVPVPGDWVFVDPETGKLFSAWLGMRGWDLTPIGRVISNHHNFATNRSYTKVQLNHTTSRIKIIDDPLPQGTVFTKEDLKRADKWFEETYGSRLV